MRSNDVSSKLTRRRFLRIFGLGGLGTAAVVAIPRGATARATSVHRWSHHATWGPGGVPGHSDVAVITKPVLLDVNASVRGLVIKPGGRLLFHPWRNVTLTSRKNVVVHGKLIMRPARHRIVHRLVFPGVKENRFKGGGMEVLASDVGLWVMDNGVLDIQGARKLAWTRSAGPIAAGATTIKLQHAPFGWKEGDELAITPTLSPSVSNHHAAYDYATVRAIHGRTVTLSGPVGFPHPRVAVGKKKAFTAEVLNLTRNVTIEGSPGGRTHILMHSARPQTIRHAAVRYAGPRKAAHGFTEGVLGRYGVHFHHGMDGSRGSLVEGVVVRDCGNHAFVAHMSNGVTFRSCISHNTFEDAYWYDQRASSDDPAPPSDDLHFDRCVASLVQSDPSFRGFRLSGFVLGAGSGDIARDCVAVGVQGNNTASGFEWPETSSGTWTFEDCVAHNNKVHGIFVWQNNSSGHPIVRFTGYHNGGAGVSHGAYLNGYRYRDSILYGNAWAAIELYALSTSTRRLEFDNVHCDQAHLSSYCVVTRTHTQEGAPVLFNGCSFRGHRQAAFGFQADGSSRPESFQIVGCKNRGNAFWLGSSIPANSKIHVHDPAHGKIVVRRFDQPGVPRPEWNATFTKAVI